jgi:hypothetical protein
MASWRYFTKGAAGFRATILMKNPTSQALSGESAETIESKRFQISRVQLAMLASEEYVRSFWWIVAIIPAFGLIAVLFGHGVLQVVGLTALLWPFSIPARSVLSSSRAGKLLAAGTRMTADGTAIYLHSDSGGGMKLDLASVRDLVVRHGYYLVRLRRLGFIPIPVECLELPEERQAFEAQVREAVTARLGQTAKA